MVMRVRYWGYLLSFLFCFFIGQRLYSYFFDVSSPKITLKGLEDGMAYAGEMECTVSSSKKGYISIFVDNKPVMADFWLAAGKKGHAFTIPTQAIVNGDHALRIEMTDSTYNKNKNSFEKKFVVDNTPLQAALLRGEEEFKVLQGRTLHVQFQLNKPAKTATMHALSGDFECFPESKNSCVYEAFIPVQCEEKPSDYAFSIDIKDKVGNATRLEDKFEVVSFPFKRSTMQVDSGKMEQEKELGRANKELEELLVAAAENSPKEKLWKGAFYTPIEVERVSTEFGKIRTTQYKGMYAHKAIDVINAPKSVVWAPQDGIVRIKDRFVDCGNTVVIDHGLGVVTMLCHLDSFADIEEGQSIKKGNPVGRIGKTGYANGYHLHWEMRLHNTAIDPMQWTQPVF